MVKNKKCRIMQVLLFAVFFGWGVSAEGYAKEHNYQLTDQAGLLEEKEASEIERKIEALEQKSGWDVMAVTTDDAEGMDSTYYAEKWFDDNTMSDDGIICLIDMDNREIVLRTFGEAITYLNDNRINTILDNAYQPLSRGEYAGALEETLDGTKKYYEKETGSEGITLIEILGAAVAALAAGGITVGAVIGSYRLKFGGYKYPIEKNGSVKLRKEEDILLNQFVTHRHIPRADHSSGGGNSTVHKGAGGRTSGGGSRKF